MGGFGLGPFGDGAFGEWYWSEFLLRRGIPTVYEQQDSATGGLLRALLEGLSPSMDGIRQKIRDYDWMRDPLRCPTDIAFERAVRVLHVDDLGDGTSRVFLSVGSEGTDFDGVRIGMSLTDSREVQFEITRISASSLPDEFDFAPVDPETGAATGKHVLVRNISQGSTELVPFVTGTSVEDEDPLFTAGSPGNLVDAYPTGLEENYTRFAPYVFNVASSFTINPGAPPPPYVLPAYDIARNRVTVTWTEGGEAREGFFTQEGKPGGDLANASSIVYTATSTTLDNGQISVVNRSGLAIDGDTIRISYTKDDSPDPDATIRAQNILAFLAADYAVELDQNDPETLQRSYVYHAYQLWDKKGTFDAFWAMGKIAGYYVAAQPLHKIDSGYLDRLPAADVFEVPPLSGTNFTSIGPDRPSFDEVAADVLPMDLFCFDTGLPEEEYYPQVEQTVTATSVTLMSSEGTRNRYEIVLSTGSMVDSFGTRGTFEDSATNVFDIDAFEWLSTSTYSIQVVSDLTPATGVGEVIWKVFKFEDPNNVELDLGDVVDLGTEVVGHSGHRYRLIDQFTNHPLSSVGNWKLIDSNGRQFYIEKLYNTTGNNYQFEVIGDEPPLSGGGVQAHIFYDCGHVSECRYCRASSLLLRISPGSVVDYPESYQGDALKRLILRLQRLVPGHVRNSLYFLDPGDSNKALAAVGVSSVVVLDNERAYQKYLFGTDGVWEGTGFWRLGEYRSYSYGHSFAYNQGGSGVYGAAGAVNPTYNTDGATDGSLRTPTMAAIDIGGGDATVTAVTLSFWHYADIRSGGDDDLVEVRVVGSATLTYDKAQLGLTDGTTGGSFVEFSADIASVVGVPFYIEFSFDSVTSAAGEFGEGWYIDDVDIDIEVA